MFLLNGTTYIPRLSPHTASSGVREPCIETISSVGHSVAAGIVSKLLLVVSFRFSPAIIFYFQWLLQYSSQFGLQ